MGISQFTPYAVGTAAENKKLRSKELIIVPQEILPFLDGELRDSPTEFNFSGQDADGTAYQGTVTSNNTIRALWLPESSNRVTAPDVRRGERVIVYRFGDSDKYFWRPMGLDDHLRKLETVIFAISATTSESKTELDIESCYFVEISSHMKHFFIHTSRANGELAAYDLELSGGEGKAILADDLGNSFLLNSVETLIKLENADGSYHELNKQNIKSYAPAKLEFVAGQEASVTVGGTKMTWLPGMTRLKTPTFKGSR